ncbi:MAG: DUF3857 and transglutaminase domain-containing protein [Bacteroidales bacterium]|nr:DUF3857 and transglutaminase domain-containing protein [Bacteroidales bacterium]
MNQVKVRQLTIVFAIIIAFTSKSYSQVLDFSTEIEIRNGVKKTIKTYRVLIRNSSQRWMSEIKLNHGYNNFKLIKAQIIDKNNKIIRKLKKREIVTYNNRDRITFFQDNIISEFNLHWNEYPYQIVYSYEITHTDFITICYWNPLVYNEVKTVKSSLSIKIPESYNITLDYHDSLEFSSNTIDGIKNLTWSCRNYKKTQKEKYSPHMYERIPGVIAIPTNFSYGVNGKSISWSTYGAWYELLNKNADVLPESEKPIIDKLIEGIEDTIEISRKLYHYLQNNTSYVNVSIKLGGFKSYPASYVCKNKYGDCKALTTYMKALLKHAGIKSNYVLINSGINKERINTKIPYPQFNHIILCVPGNQDTLWFENTSKTFPFNYIGTNNQNKKVLFIDGNNSKLIHTPIMGSDDVLNQTKHEFTLNKEGNGKFNIKSKLRGKSFEYYNSARFYLKGQELKEKIKDYIKVKNLNYENCSLSKHDKEQKYIEIYANGTVTKQIKTIGESLLIIQPQCIRIPKFEKPTKRKSAVRFNILTNKVDTTIYNLPFINEYKCNIPKNTIVKTKYGEYTIKAFRDENQIKIIQHLILNRGDYLINEYPEFYKFVQQIKKNQKKLAIILEQ